MEVFIIGNGFNLFHNLPTRYTDFYQIMKNPDDFLQIFHDAIEGNPCQELFDKYGTSYLNANIDKLQEMIMILKQNILLLWMLTRVHGLALNRN